MRVGIKQTTSGALRICAWTASNKAITKKRRHCVDIKPSARGATPVDRATPAASLLSRFQPLPPVKEIETGINKFERAILVMRQEVADENS